MGQLVICVLFSMKLDVFVFDFSGILMQLNHGDYDQRKTRNHFGRYYFKLHVYSALSIAAVRLNGLISNPNH